MKFRIHGTVGDYEDSIIIQGETIEELQKIAKKETDKRNWENMWSEKLG